MTRVLISTVLFLLAVSIELAFLRSLPTPVSFVPFVLLFTIYAFHYQRWEPALWWLVGFGVVLDLFAIGVAPFEFLSYLIVTVVMLGASRQVFTNRSYYGMAGMAVVLLLTLTFMHVVFFGFQRVFTDEIVLWGPFSTHVLWAVLLSVVLFLFIAPPLHRLRLWSENLLLGRL